MSIFIAALFTIARTWKPPRCPLTEEWIKMMQYTQTLEYYSDIKRNKFESVVMRWMNLEPVIQNEVSQKKKEKCRILTHMYAIQKDDTDEPILREGMETQMQRMDFWTQVGKKRVRQVRKQH